MLCMYCKLTCTHLITAPHLIDYRMLTRLPCNTAMFFYFTFLSTQFLKLDTWKGSL